MSSERVKIAIVGAGPGGLAAAINLLRLPYIELQIYDQASELREIGAVSSSSEMSNTCLPTIDCGQGISINENTWRHLKLLGAAEAIEQYLARGKETKVDTEHR